MIENDAIEIMKKFISGKMPLEDFWQEFLSNNAIKELLIQQEIKANRHPDWWASAKFLLKENINIKTLRDANTIHTCIRHFFDTSAIPVSIDTHLSDTYNFIVQIQPEWLDLDYNNEKFLIDIVNSAPKDLNESQKLKWCQCKIKELFKYEKTPPRWVQSSEWPIRNGKPLIFKEQSKERNESELVKFFFYNPETGEEVVIKQYF